MGWGKITMLNFKEPKKGRLKESLDTGQDSINKRHYHCGVCGKYQGTRDEVIKHMRKEH